jgi:hypothetical protein
MPRLVKFKITRNLLLRQPPYFIPTEYVSRAIHELCEEKEKNGKCAHGVS